jgi:hypothetical protein
MSGPSFETVTDLHGWSIEVIPGERSGNVGLVVRSPKSHRGALVLDRAGADRLVQLVTRASYPEGKP